MTATLIRQQLHNYLETANEKKIKAIFTMVEDEIKTDKTIWTKEFKSEMTKRFDDYKNDTVKMITQKESKKRIDNLLKTLKRI